VEKAKNQRPESRKRTPEELRGWSFTKMHMGQQLKKHYQACMTGELPPRLLALINSLDNESSKSDEPA
jgi:hypothetical protein